MPQQSVSDVWSLQRAKIIKYSFIQIEPSLFMQQKYSFIQTESLFKYQIEYSLI